MYVLIGCGSVGFQTARLLHKEGRPFKILDKNPKKCEDLRDSGLDAAQGDLENLEPFRREFEGAQAVLLLSSNMEGNLKALKYLKKEFPHLPVFVRAQDPVHVEAFERLGAERIVLPSGVVARSFLHALSEYESRTRVSRLTSLLSGAGSLAIFLQNNPDPDALASGLALQTISRHLGVPSKIYYGGAIGHQENRAFVNLLEIELYPLESTEEAQKVIESSDRIALVEASIPGKNNILPPDIVPHLVFDHHQVEESDVRAEFADVRPTLGATSTILTQYLRELEVEITPRVAVALLYGIRSDTRSFTRGATADDLAAAVFLSPFADEELLEKIETPPMAGETVDVLGRAIRNRRIYGSTLVTSVEFVRDRDTLPQAADFLLRLEGVSTVVVFGVVEDEIHVSARTSDVRVNMGEVLERAFGKRMAGGHAKMAGAQIKLGIFGDVDEREALLALVEDAIRKQILSVLGIEDRKEEE